MLWSPGRIHGARKQTQAGSRDHATAIEDCGDQNGFVMPAVTSVFVSYKNWHLSFHKELEYQCEGKKETEFVTWKRNSSEAKGQTWAMSHGVWIGEGTWGAFRERVNTLRTRLSVAHW